MGLSVFGAEATAGMGNVNRDHPTGTKICSKFWSCTGSTTPGSVNGHVSFGTCLRHRRPHTVAG